MTETTIPIDREALLQRLEQMACDAGSVYKLAQSWSIPRQELSAVKHGRREPPKRVLEKMGYEAVTFYRPKAPD